MSCFARSVWRCVEEIVTDNSQSDISFQSRMIQDQIAVAKWMSEHRICRADLDALALNARPVITLRVSQPNRCWSKRRDAELDTWMGTSNGKWEGDTFVVDVTGFNGRAWLDRAGNFSTDSLHVVERYSMLDANTLNYEATIEDPAIFTRPWKISFPLYRHREKGARVFELKCVEFVEDLVYGDVDKKPTH